jgi:hypothetical protein
MRTTTRRSHRAASSVAPHSWPKLSARRAGSSSAPGGLSTPLLLNLATVAVFLGCEGELHFLTLISAERVQEGSHCGRSGLRLRRLWILAMALAKLLVQTRYPQNSTKIRLKGAACFSSFAIPCFLWQTVPSALESPQVLLKALARLWWPAFVRYLRIELGGSSVHFFEGCKGAGRNVSRLSNLTRHRTEAYLHLINASYAPNLGTVSAVCAPKTASDFS